MAGGPEAVSSTYLDDFDAGSVRRAVRFFEPLARYHRLDVRGLEHIPDGPALLVSNHNGGLSPVDGLFLVPFYGQRGFDSRVYVLAHDVLFRLAPMARYLARHGIIPANHDHGDEVLRRGHRLLVFPGGDLESMRPYRQRHRMSFNGRTGFARLALRMGVPIVPVVSAGAHETFVVLSQGKGIADWLSRIGLGGLRIKTMPMALALPWGHVAGPGMALPYLPLPSRIMVHIDAPIEPADFSHLAPEHAALALASHVESRMQHRLYALYAERRRRFFG